MRLARSLVVGAVLLLLAQSGLARSRASATAGASVTILTASVAKLDLPSSVVVEGTGPHWTRIGSTPRVGALSLLPNDGPTRGSTADRFRLRITSADAILEVDAPHLERGASLRIEVTYHQY